MSMISQVVEPHHKVTDDGFSESRILAKVSLLPEKVRIAAGRFPVAMAAGSIQRSYRQNDIAKQVLVVLTAGWNVICYDHNLKKLWEADLSVISILYAIDQLLLCRFVNDMVRFLFPGGFSNSSTT